MAFIKESVAGQLTGITNKLSHLNEYVTNKQLERCLKLYQPVQSTDLAKAVQFVEKDLSVFRKQVEQYNKANKN